MKTIREALIDEIGYPLNEGCIENKIIARNLDGTKVFTYDIAVSDTYKGAVADCLIALISSPNFSEADKSFSLSDKELILRKANCIYNSIGEKSVALGERPMVYIGD